MYLRFSLALALAFALPDIINADVPNANNRTGITVVTTALSDRTIRLDYSTPTWESAFWNDGEELPAIIRWIAVAADNGENVPFATIDISAESFPGQHPQTTRILKTIPDQPIQIGEAASMQGVRLIPIIFHPVIDESGDLKYVRNIRVDLGLPPAPSTHLRRSAKEALGDLLIDHRRLPRRDQPEETGGYIYVVPNDNEVRELVAPLIEWRRMQGFPTVERVIQGWMSAGDIREELMFIHSNDFPVEYVCLVGDADGEFNVPTFTQGISDYPYGLLDGEDPMPEAAVGRLSFGSVAELQRMVAKILRYEQEPEAENAAYTRAAVAAGNPISGLSTILASRWVRDLMLNRGFARVDTLWWTMGRDVEGFMQGAFDRGVSFISYRGWTGLENWTAREAAGMSNRFLPVAILLGCNTGDFSGGGIGYTEALLRADGGAVGAIGSAGSHSRVNYNNALLAGYFDGMLNGGPVRLGWSLVRAKLNMFATYGDVGREFALSHANWTNLMGDPGTVVWRGAPAEVNLEVPEQVQIGSGVLTAVVTRGGEPVPAVRVGIYKPGELTTAAYTNNEGTAEIHFNPLGIDAGEATVTVSGDRIIPVSGVTEFVPSPHLVVYRTHFIDDIEAELVHGNGNGIPNPIETVRLHVISENAGNQVIAGRKRFVLDSDHEAVEIINNLFDSFGDFAPGGNIDATFLVNLLGNFPDMEDVAFTMTAAAGEERWDLTFNLTGRAPRWSVSGFVANGDLRPGQNISLDITIANSGGVDVGPAVGTLVSLSEFARVIEGGIQIDSLAVGGMQQVFEIFSIVIENDAELGALLPFEIRFESEEGIFGSSPFHIALEPLPPTEVTGPDAYGYWAIDSFDNLSNLRPNFNWTWLSPREGGVGRPTGILDEGEDDDESVAIPLPFTFRYYGQEFDWITICSNGWAALGDHRQYIDFRNLPIGTPQGPPAQLCPWWDDLYQPDAVGDVFYRYFPAEHKFVVEWYRMRRYVGPAGPGAEETFQLALLDPKWNPTYTGDGDIVFQYFNAQHEARVDGHGTPYATIGIGDPSDRGGLQYGFWNRWSDGAAPPRNSTAIRFATSSHHEYGIVKGRVVRQSDNSPLAGATLRTSTGSWGRTDEVGNFRIDKVLADLPFSLFGEADGFNRGVRPDLVVTPGDSITLEIALTNPEFGIDIEAVNDTIDAGDIAEHDFRIANGGNGELEFRIVFSLPDEGMGIRGLVGTAPRRDDPDELWDHLFGWNVTDSTGDHRILGVAFTDEGFYVSGGDNGGMTNYFYQFNRNGVLLDRIEQPRRSLWGMHDLAWDPGEGLLYGGSDDWIYRVNLEGEALDSIPSPLSPARGLAVDPESGDLWVAGVGSPIYRLDEEGNILQAFPHRLRPYGLAWHPADADDSPLYIFSADGASNLALSKLNPTTGILQPVREFSLEEGDRAGGCELALGWDTRRWTLIVVIQNAGGDRVELFDAGPNLSWIAVQPSEGTVAPDGDTECRLTIAAEGLNEGEYMLDMIIEHNAAGGEARIPVRLAVDPDLAAIREPTVSGYRLNALYPNPSNGSSVVRFSLPVPGDARLSLFDASGRLVTTLARGRLAAGDYIEQVDVQELPSGLYLVQLNISGLIMTRKLVVMK